MQQALHRKEDVHCGRRVTSVNSHYTKYFTHISFARYDYHRTGGFDGKIAIWAFAYEYEAQRSSQSRLKGTIELKNFETIDRSAFKATLLGDDKWPLGKRKQIIVAQQDNATPHLLLRHPESN
ncbi:TPA: hypothetical protein N0F65_011036, partial [Lagenidium giganteum]